MYYYQVALTSSIGNLKSGLIYQASFDYPIGSIVYCPVRNQEILGVITGRSAKPTFLTKELLPLKNGVNHIIPKHLIETASFISEYYAAGLEKVYANIIPKTITNKLSSYAPGLSTNTESKSNRPRLTPDQKKVIESIRSIDNNKPFLLYGITGSGKTEIYIQLAQEVLEQGGQMIILVPEISLTPPFVQLFCSIFGKDQVALLHSYLPNQIKVNNWRRIEKGEAKIVLGSRSAIFAPCHNLKMIIIDEEHENSYKQDQTPRYQTTRVAERIAKLTKSKLILGSATPSIQSFYRGKIKQYNLLLLNKRIVQEVMPKVNIVDMRDEYKRKNYSIFSDHLLDTIKETVAENKQVMLFLNRRGASTFVTCRDCGYVARCPNCDIALTFHLQMMKLVCHHCNYQTPIPTLCPQCHSLAIKYFGSGTEKVEIELRKLLNKEIVIARMDRDTTKKSGDIEKLYFDFESHKIDILIGTQMITKGWDLPNVDLIGIVSIDPVLNLPDYTAAERAFSLLTQVAGRTGRGPRPGKVILQTYNPDHPAVRFAKNHDYLGFYDQEIVLRKEFGYPPFVNLLKIRYNHPDKSKVIKSVTKFFERFNVVGRNDNIVILPPTPALNERIANKYRWQIIVKVKDTTYLPIFLKEIVPFMDNNWSIDVDPQDLN